MLKYTSYFGKPLSPAKFIVELVYLNLAEKKVLQPQQYFWRSMGDFYKLQSIWAAQLLKKYPPQVVIEAVKESKITTLRLKKLEPYLIKWNKILNGEAGVLNTYGSPKKKNKLRDL